MLSSDVSVEIFPEKAILATFNDHAKRTEAVNIMELPVNRFAFVKLTEKHVAGMPAE